MKAPGTRTIEPDDLTLAWGMVLNAAKMLAVLPLAEMIRACDRADAVGWVRYPTLYRDAHGKLAALTRLLRAADGFVREVEAILKEQRS